ncbi:microsomal glutathione S-transferase 3 [Octopus sinensis]|uniref:Glutathione S-transferase 3, mitochondrial n=1 Tax=Octopus sinensis TaxID=2607531 RepID=A0A6P7T800_9MOLL|nr:microsomal glutathione S-transferase 3 [Octopus sinensis]
MYMQVLELLPPAYGYVVLVAVASIFLIQWMGYKVMQARKKYDVKYPTMYSKDSNMFNCIQRVHQNTLEGYPIFLMLLGFAGLFYPIVCTICGVLWIVGKVIYANGYYTGDPEKRRPGALSYLGLLPLLAMSVMVAIQLISK